MAKLKLELDNLRVDTFDTGSEHRTRGTVRGHDTWETEWCTGYPNCGVSKRCETDNDTCFGSCGCTQGCGTGPNECAPDA
jgi:hypothetical protein